jgi:leucyl-tRNA synthetase
VERVIENTSPGRQSSEAAVRSLERKVHATIKKVTNDLEKEFGFNTAIAALMELVNTIHDLEPQVAPSAIRNAAEKVVILISPFTPHIAAEMWQRLGHEEVLITLPWPDYDESAIIEETEIVVQINGKVRGHISVRTGVPEEEVKKLAAENEKVKLQINGKKIIKIVYIPNKLVNIVVA